VVGSDLIPIVIVSVMAALVVVIVIGLHVWGAIQDGREEKEMERTRHPPGSNHDGRR
jgi:flagellar basal body-associated protein FliL